MPENCAISSAVRKTEFTITDTRLCVPVIILSTEDNIKLLKELESGFKKIVNWNKYQSKLAEQTQNRYLDFLINRSFHRVKTFCFIVWKKGWKK